MNVLSRSERNILKSIPDRRVRSFLRNPSPNNARKAMEAIEYRRIHHTRIKDAIQFIINFHEYDMMYGYIGAGDDLGESAHQYCIRQKNKKMNN